MAHATLGNSVYWQPQNRNNNQGMTDMLLYYTDEKSYFFCSGLVSLLEIISIFIRLFSADIIPLFVVVLGHSYISISKSFILQYFFCITNFYLTLIKQV